MPGVHARMAGSTDLAQRRLSALRGHLDPVTSTSPEELQGEQVSVWLQASGAHTAAAGRAESSYERIHGQVSQEPAHWQQIVSVAREELREVEYHKAAGEGIARVTVAAAVPCQQHRAIAHRLHLRSCLCVFALRLIC